MIFHSTKLPLTVWFEVIHPIMMARNGTPSVDPGRRLGVGQATARTMKRRIMAMMVRREGKKPLSGRMGIHDAHPGGVRSVGNIRGAITGTCRKPGPDHSERHSAGFARRYNRRHHLRTMIPRFLYSAARTRPILYHALIAGFNLCKWKVRSSRYGPRMLGKTP